MKRAEGSLQWSSIFSFLAEYFFMFLNFQFWSVVKSYMAVTLLT